MEKEKAEFIRLVNLIAASPNYSILEQNWQIIKNHALYDNNKTTFWLMAIINQS